MWPSLPVANHIADWANIFFIGSLVVGVVSTVLIVWMANVKEGHWDRARQASEERIAVLATQGDEAKAALGTAQADIAKANAQIAAANEGAAKANERAATLEREAAVAHLEQERLKNQMVARRVSAAQRDIIIASLAGKTIAIASFGWSPEQETTQFAQELWMTLGQAGVKLDISLSTIPISGFGVIISASGETPDLINVAAALSAAGIPFVRGPNSPHLQISVGPRPPIPK